LQILNFNEYKRTNPVLHDDQEEYRDLTIFWLNSIIMHTLVVVLALLGFVAAQHPCSRCTGEYDMVPDGQQCTSVVKTRCNGMSGYASTQWIRGTYVMSSCGSIPSGTAIATFVGPGNSYPGGAFQHAAIFISCDSTGITVDDQWAGSGGCKQRLIRTGGTGVNGAENFYTIRLPI